MRRFLALPKSLEFVDLLSPKTAWKKRNEESWDFSSVVFFHCAIKTATTRHSNVSAETWLASGNESRGEIYFAFIESMNRRWKIHVLDFNLSAVERKSFRLNHKVSKCLAFSRVYLFDLCCQYKNANQLLKKNVLRLRGMASLKQNNNFNKKMRHLFWTASKQLSAWSISEELSGDWIESCIN